MGTKIGTMQGEIKKRGEGLRRGWEDGLGQVREQDWDNDQDKDKNKNWDKIGNKNWEKAGTRTGTKTEQ